MRHAVVTPTYILKKTIDTFLYSLTSRQSHSLSSLVPILSRVPFPPGVPSGWLPLYTMVTFRPDISYATAQRKALRQGNILAGAGWVGLTLLGAVGMWLTWTAWNALALRVQISS